MILDTDILVDLDREHPAAVAWFGTLTELPLVSGLAAMELKQGCRNKRELRRVEGFLALFTLIWPDTPTITAACEQYGPLCLSHNIGVLDCLIGFSALQHGLPVATFNRKHFEALPGLTTIQPYERQTYER